METTDFYHGYIANKLIFKLDKRFEDKDVEPPMIDIHCFLPSSKNEVYITGCDYNKVIGFFKSLKKKLVKFVLSDGEKGKSKAIGFLDNINPYSMIAIHNDIIIQINNARFSLYNDKSVSTLDLAKKDIKKIIRWLKSPRSDCETKESSKNG